MISPETPKLNMLSTKIPKHTCSFGRSVSTAAVDC